MVDYIKNISKGSYHLTKQGFSFLFETIDQMSKKIKGESVQPCRESDKNVSIKEYTDNEREDLIKTDEKEEDRIWDRRK